MVSRPIFDKFFEKIDFEIICLEKYSKSIFSATKEFIKKFELNHLSKSQRYHVRILCVILEYGICRIANKMNCRIPNPHPGTKKTRRCGAIGSV